MDGIVFLEPFISSWISFGENIRVLKLILVLHSKFILDVFSQDWIWFPLEPRWRIHGSILILRVIQLGEIAIQVNCIELRSFLSVHRRRLLMFLIVIVLILESLDLVHLLSPLLNDFTLFSDTLTFQIVKADAILLIDIAWLEPSRIHMNACFIVVPKDFMRLILCRKAANVFCLLKFWIIKPITSVSEYVLVFVKFDVIIHLNCLRHVSCVADISPSCKIMLSSQWGQFSRLHK